MKRQYRVTSNLEFQKIIKNKKQLVSNYLILYYQPNKSHVRIGLSVSKKFGNAVVRNNIRRKVRAIIRGLNIWDTQYNIILITRQNFVTSSYKKQAEEVKKIFERLK